MRTGLLLITVPGLLFGTLSVLGPLRLDELGAGAAAIGAVWLIAAGLEAIVSPSPGISPTAAAAWRRCWPAWWAAR